MLSDESYDGRVAHGLGPLQGGVAFVVEQLPRLRVRLADAATAPPPPPPAAAAGTRRAGGRACAPPPLLQATRPVGTCALDALAETRTYFRVDFQFGETNLPSQPIGNAIGPRPKP